MENIENTQSDDTFGMTTHDVEDAATEQQFEAEALEAEAIEEAKVPAWIDFTAALDAHAEALGLGVQAQKGYTKYLNMETGHKLYVAKQGKEVKRVDTTLPILGQDGTYALSKPNGKIECHVIADLETVTAVLSQLADSSIGKIRQAKRQAKADVEEATELAVEILVAE